MIKTTNDTARVCSNTFSTDSLQVIDSTSACYISLESTTSSTDQIFVISKTKICSEIHIKFYTFINQTDVNFLRFE